MKHNGIKFNHLRQHSETKNEFKNFEHIGHIRTYRFLAKLPGVSCAFVAMYVFLVTFIINYPNYRCGRMKLANHRFQINHHLQNL